MAHSVAKHILQGKVDAVWQHAPKYGKRSKKQCCENLMRTPKRSCIDSSPKSGGRPLVMIMQYCVSVHCECVL